MACSSGVNCCRISNASAAAQFSDPLRTALPPIYLAFGLLSILSVGLIFLTYCLFPRLRGSSPIFLIRAGLDFLISVGDVATYGITTRWDVAAGYAGCTVIGTFNQFALMASNLLYVGLVIDLVNAIRNPFRAPPTSSKTFLAVVFGISAVLALLVYLIPSSDSCPVQDIGKAQASSAGLSMFYWCWITVQTDVRRFALITLFFYYLPNILLTVAAFTIVLWGLNILITYSGVTGSTRRQIVRQNTVFVVVFGIETILRTTMWIAGMASARRTNGSLYFVSSASEGLAVAFALIHACRGTLDLLVWTFTFSVGPGDVKDACKRLAARKGVAEVGVSLSKPLIATSTTDSVVNHSLRRDIVYCFNFGILHSIREEERSKHHNSFVGSVRDSFVGHLMVQWDSNRRDQETEDRHQDPEYVEEEEQKIRFPPSASYRSFTFVDIKPKLFALLRGVFGVSTEAYMESFKIENAADVESSGMLEKFTEGKSGSFFYFTRDYRYIIKTITPSEEAFLKKLLYSYYVHMKDNPNSIIVHFYGLHKVRLAPGQKYISVVVMNNIFHNEMGLGIHERYDLKGSRVGRSVLKGKKESKEKKSSTLKDLDLNKPIVIGPSNKEQLMEQLRTDLQFLQHHTIMDYSLLLGIHHHGDDSHMQTGNVQLSRGAAPFDNVSIEMGPAAGGYGVNTSSFNGGHEGGEEMEEEEGGGGSMQSNPLRPTPRARVWSTANLPFFRRDYGGLRSYSPHHPLFVAEAVHRYVTCAPTDGYNGVGVDSLPIDTYYFVIVDILQQYNASKSVEHHFKTKVLRQSALWISAVNPTYYAERFLSAMERIFD